MVYLSKSKYCGLWQCPKIAWLRKYKPEEFVIDDAARERMNTGNEIGDLAMGLFGDYVDVTVYNGEKIDLAAMIKRTAEEMKAGTENICEASFDYNGLYCAVDILKKDGDGWRIYEVKSSTKEKDVYYADVAYQKYVLENCGVKVTGTYLVNINKDYLFDGTIDLKQLFYISNIAGEVDVESEFIRNNLQVAEEILNNPEEPAIGLSPGCNKPYKCAFWKYCTRDIPSPSVFDLYRTDFSKKLGFYYKGLVSFDDLYESGELQNKVIQQRQLDYALNDKGIYIDMKKIREFLGKLSYPLYFLDFETMQSAIPKIVGTHPYDQVPFQYSLHYIEKEGGELQHKEFLAEAGTDPRRSVAEQLCRDIPKDVCVTAYYKSFECTRIKELARAFPDLADHLLNIESNIVDLLVPFQSGYYYKREIGGSFSIKSVLPALFPDDPSLNYHNLEGVHNGAEAMSIFPKLQYMEEDERERARNNLLKYCELDTYAMVKVWQELKRAAEWTLTDEKSRNRLIHHYVNHRPMAVISAHKKGDSAERNEEHFHWLKVDTNVQQFGYNKVGIRKAEEDAGVNLFCALEHTLIVFGNPTKESECRLRDFAVREGKKFSQDFVMLIGIDGSCTYVGTKDIDDCADNDVEKQTLYSLKSGIEDYFARINNEKICLEDLLISEDIEPYFPGIHGVPYGIAWVKRHNEVERFLSDKD